MRTILVTGSDETFAPLMFDLLDSLKESRCSIFDSIGVLDVGLSESSLFKLKTSVSYIVQPDWDMPIDQDQKKSKPHLRAKLARPFLRKYFPGYQTYIWMDADTWIQDKFALEWFVQASKASGMALASQNDHNYRTEPRTIKWRLGVLNRYFQDPDVILLMAQQYYNSGVFCLEANAPHWSSWESYMKRALRTEPKIISDQNPLNYAIWKDKLPVHSLPAICNWCCHMSPPALGPDGNLHEPFLPHRRIGIIHLSAWTKRKTIKYIRNGHVFTRSLRFGGLNAPPLERALGGRLPPR